MTAKEAIDLIRNTCHASDETGWRDAIWDATNALVAELADRERDSAIQSRESSEESGDR